MKHMNSAVDDVRRSESKSLDDHECCKLKENIYKI
ncbi:hypothetical protein [Oxyplasma meridianum]